MKKKIKITESQLDMIIKESLTELKPEKQEKDVEICEPDTKPATKPTTKPHTHPFRPGKMDPKIQPKPKA